jgi:hypothetical protein
MTSLQKWTLIQNHPDFVLTSNGLCASHLKTGMGIYKTDTLHNTKWLAIGGFYEYDMEYSTYTKIAKYMTEVE